MASTETRNAVSVRGGGKVHESIDIHGHAAAWPWCRTGSQDSVGTQYQFTDKPVNCRNCLMYAARREEAERLAAASPLAAAALQLAETLEAADAERANAPTQPTRTGPTYAAGDRISVPRGPATVISHNRGEVAYHVDGLLGEFFIPEDSPDLRPLATEQLATGSLPQHATHPDVIAARAALLGFPAAKLTADHDVTEPTGDERDVRGYLIDPRVEGCVRVFWVEAGRTMRRDQEHGTWLTDIAARLTERGWLVRRVYPSSQCVIAERPTPAREASPAVAAQAHAAHGEQQGRRCVHGYAPGQGVSGDPIAVCARMVPGQRVGVRVDVGFVYWDCAVAASNSCTDLADRSGREPETWYLMCPTHEGQPQESCEECSANDAAEPKPIAPRIPMSVGYVNRRDGEECAHIEISASDLAALTAGDQEAMTRLRAVIRTAAARFN
ncbi:hypothetical protein [Streptomyces xiamenensis]|uniref:hypothetical protein n=1 Tax=Streptomyces xiamenensis TaxID=408015 RepID=UPI003D72BCAC